MSDPPKRNKHDVKVGQVWEANDERQRPQRRQFEVLDVDLNYYPGGRARCKLFVLTKKGQRECFYARLDRFNGTKRGYSLVAETVEEAAAKTKKKASKKKAKGEK